MAKQGSEHRERREMFKARPRRQSWPVTNRCECRISDEGEQRPSGTGNEFLKHPDVISDPLHECNLPNRPALTGFKDCSLRRGSDEKATASNNVFFDRIA